MFSNEKNFRLISLLGLVLCLLGLVLCLFVKSNVVGFIGLILLVFGWFVFSTYHTKISINKLKEITNNYINRNND